MPTDERVLCIPAAHYERLGPFLGFRTADEDYRRALLDPAAYSFRPRSEVETDPRFKQLIPYVVLRYGDELFHYRRGKAGTEKRLQSLRSVGIGGHISEEDAAGGADPYRTGRNREVTEEVAIGEAYSESLLGFIHDDRTPVGSVHLGVVHLFELETRDVVPREDSLAEPGFASLQTLILQRSDFETWSQFAFDALTSR